jgi:hypothetical protein
VDDVPLRLGHQGGAKIILGLRLRRAFFDSTLAQAVQSSYYEGHFSSREQWQEALATSAVRLQWDPDHDPGGAKLERRAIQLGLRGEVLEAFSKRELLEVIDMTEFVAEQGQVRRKRRGAELRTPVETVYVPSDPAVGRRLGLATVSAEPVDVAGSARDGGSS